MTPTIAAPAAARKKAPPGCLWLEDAAEYLGIEVNTMRKWRLRNYGPGGFKVGHRVAYRIAGIDAWLAEQEASDPHSNPELRESNAPVEARTSAA